MAEKTYSESEHIAILSDRVATETAELTSEKNSLASEKAELETKLDAEVSARTAAEQRAEKAEADLETYKSEVEQEREAAARKDERIAKMREVAKHMDDEFFTDPKRVERVVAMNQESFEGYLDDIAVSAGVTPSTSTQLPRQTAMSGQQVSDAPAGKSGRNFLMRGFVAPQEA